MKIKAEDLKAGQVIIHKGLSYKILTAVKRFYKNGRAKMEVTAKLRGTGHTVKIDFKADTKIEINGDL